MKYVELKKCSKIKYIKSSNKIYTSRVNNEQVLYSFINEISAISVESKRRKNSGIGQQTRMNQKRVARINSEASVEYEKKIDAFAALPFFT